MATLEILKSLVAFDTTSRLSNLDLIDWVDDYLKHFGVLGTRVPNDEGTKSNFFATIGPHEPGGVVLSGHTDVVPVDGQTWDTDPFSLTEQDGRLYGRGTCDMKGFIACALAAVPAMNTLKRPIHLALSYDEEVGCRGVAPMVDAIVKRLPPIEAVIVGEPTMMQLINGHKGITALETVVTGVPAHSSQTQLGESAVMIAARLIDFLQNEAAALQAPDHCIEEFDPPYTTLTVNQIEGGTAINILAERCTFLWDIRSLPGDHAQMLQSAFRTFCDDMVQESAHPISIETAAFADAPGLKAQEVNTAEQLVRRISGANQSNMVAFATEAGYFQQAGYDTVVFGPGDIAQAHQPNEFVAIDQLRACDQFLNKLIAHLS
jgi:acetylornithine deacetylase